jgi:hypothetical protein
MTSIDEEVDRPDKVPCIRCGVCCVSGSCERWGNTGEYGGICESLIIHKEGHTSCKHIIEDGNPFGKGCLIRSFNDGFKIMRQFAEEKVGVKLLGIGGKG